MRRPTASAGDQAWNLRGGEYLGSRPGSFVAHHYGKRLIDSCRWTCRIMGMLLFDLFSGGTLVGNAARRTTEMIFMIRMA